MERRLGRRWGLYRRRAAGCGWVGVGQADGSRCPDVRGRLRLTVGVKRRLVAKVGQWGGTLRVGSFHGACEKGGRQNTGRRHTRRAAPAPGVESCRGRAPTPSYLGEEGGGALQASALRGGSGGRGGRGSLVKGG